jgi:hypothetical protein
VEYGYDESDSKEEKDSLYEAQNKVIKANRKGQQSQDHYLLRSR